MELVMICDMRAPDFGAPREALFEAALDMVEWADRVGFDVVGFGEHHGADDGYNPSPLILAAAVAGRTKQIRLRTAVLLAPCYDPIRLAEDLAVLQITSQGRVELGLGFGYRPSELAMYGHEVSDRFDVTMQVAGILEKAWSGDSFEFEGRTCQISPVPTEPIPILLGGTAPKVARAAAEYGYGYLVPLMHVSVWENYRKACAAHARPDPGEYPNQAPTFLWVSNDPERDWEWIAPHVLHVLDSYSRWTSEAYGKPKGPYAGGLTADTVRESGLYQVLTPEQTVELIGTLGDHSSLYLTPLFGGIDPEKGWEMLRLYEEEVHPHVPRGVTPRWGLPPANR